MEKQIEQKIKPEEQKRHLIKAYLDDEEYEKFQLFAKACKCTNSNFVRELLAGATLIEFPPKDYSEIKNQLYRAAININQLARVANAQGYVDVDEYRKQADLLMKIGAEMSMFVSYCGAQLNPRLYEPSPFLTDLLKKYDVEAKEGKGKHDLQGNAQFLFGLSNGATKKLCKLQGNEKVSLGESNLQSMIGEGRINFRKRLDKPY